MLVYISLRFLMSTSPGESTPQHLPSDLVHSTNPTQPTAPVQETQEPPAKKQKKGRSKSEAWDHFTKIEISEGVFKDARCNHCNSKVSWSNETGTSAMLKHIKSNSCPKYNYQSTIYKSPRSQHVFDQMRSRRDFAVACIKHNYPFNMGEHEFFEVYMKGVNPYLVLPSRNTIKADVLDVYEEEKIKVYTMLDNLKCKVSLTTDMWTSDHSGKPYCCVTAHYIDDSWELHKIVLAFKLLPYPHSGDVLFSFMKDRILEWNLDKKLCSIVVDNAAANGTVISKLKSWLVTNNMISFSGDLLHVRCSAHILNLIVQDGLSEIKGLLDDIRKTVRYLDRTPSAKQAFERAKQQLRIQDKREVAMDVPTRWNSTFELLETALPLRAAFDRLALSDPGYLNNPSPEEWDIAEVVLECLRTFYEATNTFSGSKYPTSNIFFPSVCDIHLKLIEWENSEHDYIRTMSALMKKKFDKYWDECNLVLGVAVVFDPRYKMHVVKYFYSKLYGDDAGIYIDEIQRFLQDLYVYYGGSLVSNERTSTSSRGGAKKGFLHGFSNWYDASNESSVQQNELEVYLKEPILPPEEDLDVLKWWSINCKRLPIMQKIARDFLAIPATTVASESAFSLGGRIISEERSLLGSDTVEALVTVKDWIPPIKKKGRQSMPIIGEEISGHNTEADEDEYET